MSKPNANTSKPPKAPRDPEKKAKPFLTKLIERVTRAIKQVNEVEERTLQMVDGTVETKHKEGVEEARGASVDAKATMHELLETLTSLQDAGYAHVQQRKSAPLAAGKQVWLRKGVWVRKYQNLYTPAELDGLQIVTVNGKLARAKTDSGLQITEPLGAFTTQPVSYENAAA